MKKKCYLSIDFEDFSHDFKRYLETEEDPSIRREALELSYLSIDDFCKKHLNGARITFFITGILADKFPKIVEKIAKDGHEVACHYYYHDIIFNDSAKTFEYNLKKAITYLENASNQKIKGFRAPRFSINEKMTAHYKAMDKYIFYDSSLNLSSSTETDRIKEELKLKMSLFPVPKIAVKYPPFVLKSGGTYLKLFPLKFIKKCLDITANQGIIPMVYLHPYEFVSDRSFFLKFSELSSLPFTKKLYWYLRQHQWHSVGNSTVKKKLEKIFEHFEVGGRMDSLIDS